MGEARIVRRETQTDLYVADSQRGLGLGQHWKNLSHPRLKPREELPHPCQVVFRHAEECVRPVLGALPEREGVLPELPELAVLRAAKVRTNLLLAELPHTLHSLHGLDERLRTLAICRKELRHRLVPIHQVQYPRAAEPTLLVDPIPADDAHQLVVLVLHLFHRPTKYLVGLLRSFGVINHELVENFESIPRLATVTPSPEPSEEKELP
mmetsp:Transcript_45227/g.125504  ORF Transcript_45227/g.125504 Transcript_45227/m.125504 type:complete len:209 (-) Transcript_45227:441-1067(-)